MDHHLKQTELIRPQIISRIEYSTLGMLVAEANKRLPPIFLSINLNWHDNENSSSGGVREDSLSQHDLSSFRHEPPRQSPDYATLSASSSITLHSPVLN